MTGVYGCEHARPLGVPCPHCVVLTFGKSDGPVNIDNATNPAPQPPSPDLRQKILLWPHPTLKKVSVDVHESFFVKRTDGTTHAQNLADKMLATMYAAQGAGLSANQIDIPMRVICLDVSSDKKTPAPIVMFNPKIEATVGKMTCQEGCLSVPGFYADMERDAEIMVTYLNVLGEPQKIQASGPLSDAIQHECDHLLGITFVEKLSYLKQDIARRKMQKIRKTLKRFDKFKQEQMAEIETGEVRV